MPSWRRCAWFFRTDARWFLSFTVRGVYRIALSHAAKTVFIGRKLPFFARTATMSRFFSLVVKSLSVVSQSHNIGQSRPEQKTPAGTTTTGMTNPAEPAGNWPGKKALGGKPWDALARQ
jgi:hypothetical protein